MRTERALSSLALGIGIIALLIASYGVSLEVSTVERLSSLEAEIAKPRILYALKDVLNRTVVVLPRGGELPPAIPEDWVIVRIPTERIVSFAPSLTATLFKMGLGDKVVAVTKWDDWPPEVVEKREKKQVVVLESIIEPEVEKVIETKPDIILTIKIRPEKFRKFEELGVPVVVIDYGDSIESILRAILMVGFVTGAEQAATNLAKDIREGITKISQKVAGASRLKVFWLVWHSPLMTAGGPSFITALLEAAGAVNAFKDLTKAWPIIGKEEVLKRDPDVIILTEGFKKSTANIKSLEDFLILFPEFKDLKAVREKRFFFVPDAAVQPGPRTPEMVELIARLLHPSLFTALVPVYARA